MAANPPKDQIELGLPLKYTYTTRGASVHRRGELRPQVTLPKHTIYHDIHK